MTIGRLYGLPPGTVGDRQVAQAPTTKAARPPLLIDRNCRNGKHPDADFMNEMCGAMNAAMVYRTKQVFAYSGILGSASGIGLSSNVADVLRHRFAFHTSPYTNMLLCRAVLYPQTTGFTSSSRSTLDITNSAGTVLFTTDFTYGCNPLNSANLAGWQHLKITDKQIAGLSADTDYYGLVTDKSYGLLQSISVAELNSMTTNYNGYLPMNFTGETNVVAEYRANLVAPMPLLWKRGGAQVFNWTVNLQASPRTIAVNTATNVFDGTATTYGSSIPGVTLDMRGRARRSQPTGVPVKMACYLKCSAASNGVIHLRDSAGTIVMTITNTMGAGTAGWITTTGNLPATLAKYYLTHQTASGTLSTYAASIFQYE